MSHFNGFPKEGLAFLSNIIINNSKAWPDDHKEEYEKYIVSPKVYVEEMGEHLLVSVMKKNIQLKLYEDNHTHKSSATPLFFTVRKKPLYFTSRTDVTHLNIGLQHTNIQ